MVYVLFSLISFKNLATCQKSNTPNKHSTVKLTSPIQVNDTIVVTGVIMDRQGSFKIQTKTSDCFFCVPLAISLHSRTHKVEVSTMYQRKKITYKNSRKRKVAAGNKFELLVRVSPDTLEVELNGDFIVNVPYKKNILRSIKNLRSYSVRLEDLYVIPYDINTPEIYEPDGENHYGRRPSMLQSRIIGGKKAKRGEYPWQAAIRFVDRPPWSPIKHECGAVLISSCWVLTAAHCLQTSRSEGHRRFMDYRNIRFGDLFNGDDSTLFAVSEADEDEQDIQMDRLIIHPDYNFAGDHPVNDIALIRLKPQVGNECVHYSGLVQPIILPPPTGYNVLEGSKCFVSGWGAMNWTHESLPKAGSVLMWTDVKVRNFENCVESYGKDFGVDRIQRGMFCANGKGKDTCKGDSGGPIYCNQRRLPENTVLSGVTSFGIGCANEEHPGVYVDVSMYMEWIIKITGASTEKSPPRHTHILADKFV